MEWLKIEHEETSLKFLLGSLKEVGANRKYVLELNYLYLYSHMELAIFTLNWGNFEM